MPTNLSEIAERCARDLGEGHVYDGDAARIEAALREAVDRREAELQKMWRETMAEELGETFKLIQALGVYEEIKNGRACMDAMLGKIAELTRTQQAAQGLVEVMKQFAPISSVAKDALAAYSQATGEKGEGR